MLCSFDICSIDLYVNMYYEIFTSPPWNFYWLEKKKVNQYFRDMVHTPGFLGYTYEHNKQTVGVCFGIANDYFAIPQYYIKEFFVRRDAQGKNYGSKMLNEVEEDMCNKKITSISLQTSTEAPAFGFYQHHGYAAPPYAVHMTKMISGK